MINRIFQPNAMQTRLCLLTAFVCLAVSLSCREKQQTPVTGGQRHFPMVDIPTVYTDPEARAGYLALHYWDRFDFRDTVYTGSAALVSEQALVDYLDILSYVKHDAACEGLTHLMHLAEADAATYAFFASTLERYLYDPNSPMRNDEFFIPVLAQMIASEKPDDAHKVRLRVIWGYLQKNRPGTLAADIHYQTVSGQRHSLSDIRSEYVLLVFHNLGCNACLTLIDRIENSATLQAMQQQKRLRILAIYPDKQLDEWKKHLTEIPSTWLNGFDYNAEIENKETYILRAIPSVYLLDRNRRVVLRDASMTTVEQYFSFFSR